MWSPFEAKCECPADVKDVDKTHPHRREYDPGRYETDEHAHRAYLSRFSGPEREDLETASLSTHDGTEIETARHQNRFHALVSAMIGQEGTDDNSEIVAMRGRVEVSYNDWKSAFVKCGILDSEGNPIAGGVKMPSLDAIFERELTPEKLLAASKYFRPGKKEIVFVPVMEPVTFEDHPVETHDPAFLRLIRGMKDMPLNGEGRELLFKEGDRQALAWAVTLMTGEDKSGIAIPIRFGEGFVPESADYGDDVEDFSARVKDLPIVGWKVYIGETDREVLLKAGREGSRGRVREAHDRHNQRKAQSPLLKGTTHEVWAARMLLALGNEDLIWGGTWLDGDASGKNFPKCIWERGNINFHTFWEGLPTEVYDSFRLWIGGDEKFT